MKSFAKKITSIAGVVLGIVVTAALTALMVKAFLWVAG